ncbi:Autophagy-related protein 17 [Forsythia ovata]|uniref:Autophagy-related protein 17 n=1 Tax=Forsythia ovata TaxID=205694 RepID=A0ABD1R353_9LAMI
MSSNASEGAVLTGKLVVHIAENGHSYELDCDEYTRVEALQKHLESVSGIPFNDQLLMCLNMKLELQCPLSVYKLPSNDREVFLFNKARMRSDSPPPGPEQVEVIDIPDPPLSSSSHNPHPLDDATDPALKALPSYERQFSYHFQSGHSIYRRALAKIETCERLFQEQKVQERALEIARGSVDHFYKMILRKYTEFVKRYTQQHQGHNNCLVSFGRDIEKLRSTKLFPALQTADYKCLLDFVKVENLWKMVEDCSSSHRQIENKVSEFKEEFGELKLNIELLFSSRASFLINELDIAMKDHRRHIHEQKSIMLALSKDVDTVKKLTDDCVTSQLSSSLRPFDAVSALGPMYDDHDKSYLPKMQSCGQAISNLLDFCRDKKNEMNAFVHDYLQRIAYIQYFIKNVHYKFPVFNDALKRQNDQFEHLKVVRGIGPAYRACLAEVVRRKATMKLYVGMAGQLVERLATNREAEVRRCEEFLKVYGRYIPPDILASMGLYSTPNQSNVDITPFDSNLLDIDLSDVDHYAPESLLGLSSKSEKHGTLKSSLSISNDGSQPSEVEGSSVKFSEKYDPEKLLQGSELLEIAGTSKMEVENVKLKDELASKIALMCTISTECNYESIDDCKTNSLLKNAAEETSEKYLQSVLKVKQMQCESYEKRIQELEQRLSDQYLRAPTFSAAEHISNSALSTVKTDENKSETSGAGEIRIPNATQEVSCASNSLKSRLLPKEDKSREGLGDNVIDPSGMLNPQLDSSMLDTQHGEGHLFDKDKKETLEPVGGTKLAASSMAVSVLQPADVSSRETALEPDLVAKVSNDLVLGLQSALAEKSNQLSNVEIKLQALVEEVSKLERDLENSRKLVDESQINFAHLENCLNEAREEAQIHLHAADCRASEESALHTSAIEARRLFERLRSCISSAEMTGFSDSLRALAQSLSNSTNENEDDITAEFRECIHVFAKKVDGLSRDRFELLDRSSKAKAEVEQLKEELDEKTELVNTLYMKHQLEEQANKEKISFGRLEVHEIAAFVLNSAGNYEAINRHCPYYYLSAESVALFADHLPTRPSYIVGQIVHIERQTVKSLPSTPNRDIPTPTSDTETSRLILNSGSTSNPYGLPVGCEYFVVTVAMLPNTSVLTPPPS